MPCYHGGIFPRNLEQYPSCHFACPRQPSTARNDSVLGLTEDPLMIQETLHTPCFQRGAVGFFQQEIFFSRYWRFLSCLFYFSFLFSSETLYKLSKIEIRHRESEEKKMVNKKVNNNGLSSSARDPGGNLWKCSLFHSDERKITCNRFIFWIVSNQNKFGL